MTIPKVNVGTQPNDKTGDTPREAFSKVNTAFDTFAAGIAAAVVAAGEAANTATVDGLTDAGDTGKLLAKAATAVAAVQAQAIALQSGFVLSTWASLFDDLAVYVHRYLPADTPNPSSAQQQAALTAAVAQAKARYALSGTVVPIVFVRNWEVTASTTLDFPCHVFPVSIGIVITPRAKMRTVFEVTCGQVCIENFRAINPSNPAIVLDYTSRIEPTRPATGSDPGGLGVLGAATSFVRVEKRVYLPGTTTPDPLSTKQILLFNLDLTGFPEGIDWADGQNPYIVNLECTKCGVAIFFRNSGMNGFVSNVQNHAGGGARIFKDYGRTGVGPAVGGAQGMEGTTFFVLKPLQTVEPAFGYKDPPVYLKDSGYKLLFVDYQPQELVWSAATLIIGDLATIDGITFSSIFHNTNSDGMAANPSNVFNCYDIQGSVKRVSIIDGRASDYRGRFIAAVGKSAADTVYHLRIRDVTEERNAMGPFFLRNASGWVKDNGLLSTVGGDEDDTCSFNGQGNEWGANPARLSYRSDWSDGQGANAPPGLPTAAQVSGKSLAQFPRGRKYTQTGGAVYNNGST